MFKYSVNKIFEKTFIVFALCGSEDPNIKIIVWNKCKYSISALLQNRIKIIGIEKNVYDRIEKKMDVNDSPRCKYIMLMTWKLWFTKCSHTLSKRHNEIFDQMRWGTLYNGAWSHFT